jgi:hypothetical protein
MFLVAYCLLPILLKVVGSRNYSLLRVKTPGSEAASRPAFYRTLLLITVLYKTYSFP